MLEENTKGLSGLTVALFESRRGEEFTRLVGKQGAQVVIAPSIVEAPLELGPELISFVAALRQGEVDALLVLTGAGNRKLVELVAPLMDREELAERLRAILVVARGPKSVVALKELGVKPQVVAPEPHTWQSLMDALKAHTALTGKRVALQQYGVPHEKLTQALLTEGAQVTQVPVYRWQLPEDLSPILSVIDAIVRAEVDVILFAAGPQAGSLFDVAARNGREAALRQALLRCAIGSIGPSCTEALRNLELEPDFEPEHGKMGQLVLLAARQVREVLAAKRR